MEFNHLKNAIVYSAELPGATDIAKHLLEHPFEELPENMLSRSGFVPNAITGELVTEFQGGYSFTLREDSKVLPMNLVMAEANKLIKAAEKSSGVRLKKVERQAIAEQTLALMCKKALVESSYITCFYHIDEKLLIVLTASKMQARMLVGVLVHVVGSVKTTTIHISDIKNGLTTRLKNHLQDQERAFGDLHLGGLVELKKKGQKSQKVSYQLDDLAEGRAGLLEALESKLEVHAIRFEHGEMDFKLNDEFKFSSISFASDPDYDTSELEDIAHIWRHEAAIQLLEFVATVKHICDLLGYVPPVDEEDEAA
jgi:recombination associated protein RdgC